MALFNKGLRFASARVNQYFHDLECIKILEMLLELEDDKPEVNTVISSEKQAEVVSDYFADCSKFGRG